jgi:hypothetical protein
MERYELSTMINWPIEEVFAVLANLENDLKWRTEWVDARKTSEGPIGLGTRFSLIAKAFGRRIETVYETIQYEPNRIAAWKAMSGPLPLTFRRTVERVEGGTCITKSYMRRNCAASSNWLCRSLPARSGDSMKAICAS